MGWMLPVAMVASQAIGSAVSASSAAAANKANRSEADAQREWEQMMSSTAHQREVTDLRAAGLNPILSAGGSGAVSPMGASATNQQSILPNLGNEMSSAVSGSAQSYYNMQQKTKDIKGQDLTNQILSEKLRGTKADADVSEYNRDIQKNAAARQGSPAAGGGENWTTKALNAIRAVSDSLGGLFHASASATGK